MSGQFLINNSVKTEKRYDLQRFVERIDGAYEVVNAYLLTALRQLKPAGQYIIKDLPHRPDMISHDIYGDTQYWYLLMDYNNILELTDLHKGRNLNYFSLVDLEQLYLELSAKSYYLA